MLLNTANYRFCVVKGKQTGRGEALKLFPPPRLGLRKLLNNFT